MSRLRAIVLLALLCGGTALAWWLAVRAPGRVLYLGGQVLTMDGSGRVADALLTDGPRIRAVGSESEVRAVLGSRSARVVELRGRTLMPGFIDAHGHFPGAGLYEVMADLNSPPIGEVRSTDDLVERLRALAADTDPGEWVVGMGYDDSLILEGRHPTRTDLDRASTEHLVAVTHVSGHLGVLNSAALAHYGIDSSTADPVGGRIVRDSAGQPTGLLEEEAVQRWLAPLIQPDFRQAIDIVRAANDIYLAQGVTTAQSGLTNGDVMRALALGSRFGLVQMRLVILPDAELAGAQLDGEASAGPDSEWVRVGAVKLVADGSIQGYTGYLREPYHVPPGDDPTYRGYPRIPRADLMSAVARFHGAGRQLAIHGNGDASIDDILDALESAQHENPRADSRHIIIHAQMARDDQLDRMRDLGVIPSFFVLHTYYWGDRHRDIFMGPERAARMSPTGSALRRGIHFTLHADTPVVPMEPLRLVWCAVNRLSTGGASIGPRQRIDPMSALRAVTIDAARQHFLEANIGSLEVGKLADMIILDRSPLENPQAIDAIRVDETVIGGRVLYRRR